MLILYHLLKMQRRSTQLPLRCPQVGIDGWQRRTGCSHSTLPIAHRTGGTLCCTSRALLCSSVVELLVNAGVGVAVRGRNREADGEVDRIKGGGDVGRPQRGVL